MLRAPMFCHIYSKFVCSACVHMVCLLWPITLLLWAGTSSFIDQLFSSIFLSQYLWFLIILFFSKSVGFFFVWSLSLISLLLSLFSLSLCLCLSLSLCFPLVFFFCWPLYQFLSFSYTSPPLSPCFSLALCIPFLLAFFRAETLKFWLIQQICGESALWQ